MCEFLIILHIVSLYVGLTFTPAIMLRSARHRTSQKKKTIYTTWKVLWGSVCPQAEININKK